MIDPDQPHRYQPWPIPSRKNREGSEANVGPGSIGYWRHYNPRYEAPNGAQVDLPTPCALAGCGASPTHPVHFIADWKPRRRSEPKPCGCSQDRPHRDGKLRLGVHWTAA